MNNKNTRPTDILFGITLYVVIAILSLIVHHIFKISNIMYIVIILFCVSVLIITYIVGTIIHNKEVKRIEREIEKEYDNTKGYDYYREKLDNYSPAILMYISKKRYDFKKVFIANILNLINKKYISIIDNRLTVINDDYSNLSDDESYILRHIKDKDINKVYANRNSKKIMEEVIKINVDSTGLLTKIKDFDKMYNKYNSFLSISLIVVVLISFLNLFGTSSKDIVGALKGMGLYFSTGIILVICSVISQKLFNKFYKRSETAIEMSVKLGCLERFIKDFSELKDKSIDEIALWDDYMIYTIMLDIDGEINKSINEFANKYLT